jgi:hypothetical protein
VDERYFDGFEGAELAWREFEECGDVDVGVDGAGQFSNAGDVGEDDTVDDAELPFVRTHVKSYGQQIFPAPRCTRVKVVQEVVC